LPARVGHGLHLRAARMGAIQFQCCQAPAVLRSPNPPADLTFRLSVPSFALFVFPPGSGHGWTAKGAKGRTERARSSAVAGACGGAWPRHAGMGLLFEPRGWARANSNFAKPRPSSGARSAPPTLL